METPRDLGFDFLPDLPVPISQVGGRYLLFDTKIATYLRREHRICGTQTGTLPLAPSQNLFLGVPIEIMPEEAQLLVEKGVGFILDDARTHDQAMRSPDKARRADYLASVCKQSKQLEQVRIQEKEQARKRALSKQAKMSPAGTSTPCQDKPVADLLDFDDGESSTAVPTESSTLDETASLQSESTTKGRISNTTSSNYHVTPTTSQFLLSSPPQTQISAVRDLPASYPMYKHLHENGFFMTPGLRFGCQYTVYPGDPLRFHSHFLAVGVEWDEPIELMDIVGGGRLGTGVKKGFLLGGASPAGDVRTFSVEWAVM